MDKKVDKLTSTVRHICLGIRTAVGKRETINGFKLRVSSVFLSIPIIPFNWLKKMVNNLLSAFSETSPIEMICHFLACREEPWWKGMVQSLKLDSLMVLRAIAHPVTRKEIQRAISTKKKSTCVLLRSTLQRIKIQLGVVL